MLKSHKITINYMLIYICIIFMQISFVEVYADSSDMKEVNDGFNVLVINSYSQEHIWESNILDGLKNNIDKDKDNDINLNIEYLDFKNKNDQKYIKSFKEMIEAKYSRGSIDVLYTVGDEAYTTFEDEVINENSNLYKIPLVFSCVNKVYETIECKKYSSGIYHRDDSLQLFNIIERLNPNPKNVNVIIENSQYGELVKKEIDTLVEGYLKEYIKVNYIISDYIEEISMQLDTIEDKPNAVNIIAGEFKSKKSKKYLEAKNTIDIIKKSSNAPIYSTNQIYLNAGILGGNISIAQEHADMVYNIIIKIRNGENIESIPSYLEPKASSYIDYKSIYKYNINPKNITKEDKIINKKFYELMIPIGYKVFFMLILILIVIGILIFYFHKVECRENKLKKEYEEKEKEEREKLKTDFIVNLSHELRTPINVILGISKILEININKDNIDKNDILNKLNNINQNSYRLLKISNNIIDITKAESGMLELQMSNYNIVDVVEEAFTSSINVAKRKNIDMIFDTDIEEIITTIDKFQIQRVILNILSNAIKFTEVNGLICVCIIIKNNNVVIEVKDNGVGIPNEKINHIFHRFYQVDSLFTRKSEGSGIGLCLVKDIVEIHNGKIEVESELGEGTSFKIYIPIKAVDDYVKPESAKISDIDSIVDLEMSDI